MISRSHQPWMQLRFQQATCLLHHWETGETIVLTQKYNHKPICCTGWLFYTYTTRDKRPVKVWRYHQWCKTCAGPIRPNFVHAYECTDCICYFRSVQRIGCECDATAVMYTYSTWPQIKAVSIWVPLPFPHILLEKMKATSCLICRPSSDPESKHGEWFYWKHCGIRGVRKSLVHNFHRS